MKRYLTVEDLNDFLAPGNANSSNQILKTVDTRRLPREGGLSLKLIGALCFACLVVTLRVILHSESAPR